MSRILLGEPIPTQQFQTQVSPELQTLLSKMLRKDKAARYQSAQDFLTDLRGLPAQRPADKTKAEAPSTNEVSASTRKETAVGRLLTKAQRNTWALLATGSANGWNEQLALDRALGIFSDLAVHLCLQRPSTDG
jgi:serine/threonine protein kinase